VEEKEKKKRKEKKRKKQILIEKELCVFCFFVMYIIE
jgi:hypothetical protein